MTNHPSRSRAARERAAAKRFAEITAGSAYLNLPRRTLDEAIAARRSTGRDAQASQREDRKPGE